MKKFLLANIRNASVISIYNQREEIYLEAEYQRISDIWPMTKRQLLIDSLLNGYDIPKFYFHEFHPAKKIGNSSFNYAIIDGKQRLSSIWSFINNEFPLADDFEYQADISLGLQGLTYREISESHPNIRDLFNAISLDITTIVTDDTEIIEDMFSRLNEAVPLNAAEKRNAFGGPVPKAIKRLAQHDFFKTNIPFKNARYRYLDLATKFLFLYQKFYIEGEMPDTSKKHLDGFVKYHKASNKKKMEKLNKEIRNSEKGCKEILSIMNGVFTKSDELLRSVGMIIIYFILFCDVEKGAVKRKDLIEFKEKRKDNRTLAEEDLKDADYDLLEFDRLIQSPNNKSALIFRLKILEEFFGFNGD